MSQLRNFLIAGPLVAVCGAGLLFAQDKPAGDPPEAATPKKALTPEAMREATVEIIEEVRGKLARLVELRKLARDSKDVIKLNCVNDKLLLYKQVVNLAEEAQVDMAEAIAQSDEAGRHRHYDQVLAARARAHELRRAAEACIGVEMEFVGPTRLLVDEPLIDELDRAAGWFELDDPKYATPFN